MRDNEIFCIRASRSEESDDQICIGVKVNGTAEEILSALPSTIEDLIASLVEDDPLAGVMLSVKIVDACQNALSGGLKGKEEVDA